MSATGDNDSPPPLPDSESEPVTDQYAQNRRLRRSWPVWARVVCILGALVIVFLLAGFFIAPPIAKSVLEKQLTAQLSSSGVQRVATIEKVRINPLELSCTIEGLKIMAEGREPLVLWRRFFASFDLRTLVSREWRFREIALDGFNGRVEVGKDGRLNFADLTETHPSTPPEKKEGKSRALHVNLLTVTDAHIHYLDNALQEPFATSLGPVSFTVTDFQTGGPDQAPGEFSAKTEAGETLAWKGSLAVAPLFSRGEIRIGNFDLKKYAPFYGHRVRFDVLAGTIDVVLRYEVEQRGDHLIARAQDSDVTLHNITLSEQGKTVPAIAVDTIEVTGLSATSDNQSTSNNTAAGVDVASASPVAVKQSLRIAKVSFNKGSAALRHDANGFSLAELFKPAAAPSDAPNASVAVAPSSVAPQAPVVPSATPVFDVAVDDLEVRDFIIGLEDVTLANPLRAQMELTSFSAKNFDLNKLDAPLPVELAAKITAGGTLEAKGDVALLPLKGKLNVVLTDAALVLTSAHLSELMNAKVNKGAVSAKVAVTMDPASGIVVAGDARVADFSVVDSTGGSTIQSWKSLDLRGISFSNKPDVKVAIREIALDGAATNVAVLADGKLNISGIAKTPSDKAEAASATPTNAEAADKSAPSSSRVFVTIEKVTLNDSRVDFSDQSIQPPVKMALADINGSISGLSSENMAHANVDLHAKVDGKAPVSLTGQINPLSDDVFTDLKLSMQGAELTPLGSYVAKYAGKTLERGTMNVEVTTRLSKRFLDSSNVITLNQFELGQNTNSPDATKLPVGLAVSLLRDSQGKIVLDVPVKGSLDDPDFKYGRAVWRAVGNLLVKAATAPFTLLTAALGVGGKSGGAGGGAVVATVEEPGGAPAVDSSAAGGAPDRASDLSVTEFDAGATAPNAVGLHKLELLVQALRVRPGLGLNVAGGFDPESDGAALRRASLVRMLKEEYWAELGGEGGAKSAAVAAENMELTPEIENRLVERLYQRRFGIEERTDLNTPGSRYAPVATVVPPKTTPTKMIAWATGGKTSSGIRSITRVRDVSDVRSASWPEMAATSGTPLVSARANVSANESVKPTVVAASDTAENTSASAPNSEPLPSVEDMRAKLLETIPVNDDQLKLLASVRAEAVKEYLINQGKLSADRVAVVGNPTHGAIVSMQLR